MALNVGELEATIRARDDFSATLKAATDAFGALGSKVGEHAKAGGEAMKGMANEASSMGSSLMQVFTSPIEGIKELTSQIGEKLGGALKMLGPEGAVAAEALAGLAAAGAAISGVLFGLADHAANAGESVKAFSDKTGIAVANVGPLEFAAKAAGGSLDTLTNILGKMDMKQATDSGGKFSAALKDIGINADAFGKMDNEQKLLAVAKGFQEGAKSGDTMRTATDLMGKSGRENIPLLLKMTDDLMESGKKLGIQWTDDSVKAAEEFKVGLDTAKTAVENITTRIGVELLPTMSAMLKGFADSPEFMNGVTSAVDALAHGLGALIEFIGNAFDAVTHFLAPLVAWNAFMGTVIVETIGGLIHWIEAGVAAFEAFGSGGGKLSFLGDVFTAIKNAVVSTVSTMLGWLEKIPGVGPVIKDAIANASSSFDAMANAGTKVKGVTDTVGDALLATGHKTDAAALALAAHNKLMSDATAAAAKYQQAVEAIVQALEGDSKKTHENIDAITQVIKSGNDDVEVRTRVVDSIEKLYNANVKLTPELEKYRLANFELTKEGKDQIDIQKRLNEMLDIAAGSFSGVEPEVLSYARQLIAAGAATKDISAVTQLSAEQVKQLGHAMKDSAKVATETAAVVEEAASLERKAWGDTTGEIILNVGKWRQAKIDALDKDKISEQERAVAVEAINRLANDKIMAAEESFSAKRDADLVKAVQSYSDYKDKIAEIGLDGTALKLKQLDVQYNAAIKAAQLEAGENTGMYALLKGEIDEYYGHQQALAIGTASTIEERMRAAGVNTIGDMHKQADAYGRDYRQMQDDGQYTFAQLEAARKKWQDADDAANGKMVGGWSAAMQAIGQSFAALGSGSHEFDKIAGSAGSLLALYGKIEQGNSSIADSFKKIGSNTGGLQQNLVTLSGAVVSVIGDFENFNKSITDAEGKTSTLSSTMKGAEIGTKILPGWGTAIGAAVGAIYGWIKSMGDGRRAVEEFANSPAIGGFDELHKKLEVLGAAGEEMWKKMSSTAKGDADAAKKIIEEITKALASSDAQMQLMLRDIEAGGEKGAAALDKIDKSWATFVKDGTDASGLVSKSLEAIIAEEEKLGTTTANVAKYRADQMKSAEAGIADAMKVTSDAYAKQHDDATKLADLNSRLGASQIANLAKIEDLKKKMAGADAEHAAAYQNEISSLLGGQDSLIAQILQLSGDYNDQAKIIEATQIASEEEASAVAAAEIAAVDAKVAAGETWIQAVKDQKAEILGLAEQLKKTGFDGGEAFDYLTQEVNLATDKVAGPALSAMEGYTQAVVGLNNSGHLTQEMYQGLESRIATTQKAIEAQGFSHGEVMTAMQHDLQIAWELQQKYNYKVDDATQALIDEAVKTGEVGEKHKSTTEQMLDLTQKMTDAIIALAEHFGVTGLGGALDKTATKAATTFGGMSDYAKDAAAGVGGISTQLDKIDWEKAANDASDALGKIKHDADTAALGASPGGVREIATQFAAVAAAASDAAAVIGPALDSVKGQADTAADNIAKISDSFKAGQAAADSLGSTIDSITKADFSSAMSAVKGVLGGKAPNVDTLANDVRDTKQKSDEAALAKQIALDTAFLAEVHKAGKSEVDIIAKINGEKEKLAAMQVQRQSDDLHQQYDQVVKALGPVPNQYGEIYKQTTAAIKSNLDIQDAALAKQRQKEMDGLGPVPKEYDATYQAAKDAVDQKYNLMIAKAHAAAQDQIDAIGPIPEAYDKKYHEAFDLVQKKYSILLRDLGVEPNLSGIPEKFDESYTKAFDAAKKQLDLLSSEQALDLAAQKAALDDIPAEYSDAYREAFARVGKLYGPFLDSLKLPDWILHPPTPAPIPHPGGGGTGDAGSPGPGWIHLANGAWVPPNWFDGQAHPQALGGDYVVTSPTLFLAGEAGPEAISFSGANNSRGWGSDPNVASELAAIRRLLERQPQAMQVALKDALVLMR